MFGRFPQHHGQSQPADAPPAVSPQQRHAEHLAEANRKFHEAVYHVHLAGELLRQAVAAERDAGQVQRDALSALAALGEADPTASDQPAPSPILARVENSPLLRLIHNGHIN